MRTIHVIRLQTGQDLKLSIGQFVKEHAIRAGWVVTCVGSVTQYHLRFANQREGQTGEGFFEIINLSGTLSLDGCHLHITLGDGQGVLTGGHLLEGCIVYTTAEVVIEESTDYVFTREKDDSTGWKELRISK